VVYRYLFAQIAVGPRDCSTSCPLREKSLERRPRGRLAPRRFRRGRSQWRRPPAAPAAISPVAYADRLPKCSAPAPMPLQLSRTQRLAPYQVYLLTSRGWGTGNLGLGEALPAVPFRPFRRRTPRGPAAVHPPVLWARAPCRPRGSRDSAAGAPRATRLAHGLPQGPARSREAPECLLDALHFHADRSRELDLL